MAAIKKQEKIVYKSILNGDLEIASDGRIWRIARRGWNRWKNKVTVYPCEKRRAEREVGTGYLQVR